MDAKGESGGGMNWEIGINIYTLLILCIKQITEENLETVIQNKVSEREKQISYNIAYMWNLEK